MQKLVIGMRLCKTRNGFTLIEILVVMVIIGITINFAMLSFGDFGERRKVVNAAEHFTYFTSLLKKEAILTGQTLAIQIKKDNYSALKLKNNTWQTMQNGIYKNQKLPKNIVMFLTVPRNAPRNLIIINQMGNITPFNLDFGKNKDNIMVTISCNNAGILMVKNYGK